MIDTKRKNTASIMWKFNFFPDFRLLSAASAWVLLLSKEELVAEKKGSTTSQKDFVISEGASTSRSKIVEAYGKATMDINSTQ